MVQAANKISRDEALRIVQEPNGASALIVMLRDDKVDLDTAIEVITRAQDLPSSKFKRVLMAAVEALFPG